MRERRQVDQVGADGHPRDGAVGKRTSCLERAAQHSARPRPFRPHLRELLGDHGVAARGGNQRSLVLGMGARLLGRDEHRAHPHAGGAGGERGGESPTGRDAARGEHRYVGADRVEDVEQQRPQRAPTVQSAAALDAPHDEQVDSGVDGLAGVVDRADLPCDRHSVRLRERDELRIGAGMVEVDQPAALRRDRHDRGVRDERHEEVHAQRRDVGERVELIGDCGGWLERERRHAHRSRADDAPNQAGGTDATHRRQLHRHPATDQVGESCRPHRSSPSSASLARRWSRRTYSPSRDSASHHRLTKDGMPSIMHGMAAFRGSSHRAIWCTSPHAVPACAGLAIVRPRLVPALFPQAVALERTGCRVGSRRVGEHRPSTMDRTVATHAERAASSPASPTPSTSGGAVLRRVRPRAMEQRTGSTASDGQPVAVAGVSTQGRPHVHDGAGSDRREPQPSSAASWTSGG